MHRLLSAVTARAATRGVWAWGCGRRGAHQRARLPQLGPGWVGGLGLGLGLALGVKLAGGLRGAVPTPPPAAPDPEASPEAERPPPPEESLAGWSPQTPVPPISRRFARAIDSSRDLLHRIKVRRRGGGGDPEPGSPSWVSTRNGALRWSSSRAERTPPRAVGCPQSASEKDFPFSDLPASERRSWGVAQVGGGGHRPPRGPPLPSLGASPAHPAPLSARSGLSRCGRGPGGEGGAKPGEWSR